MSRDSANDESRARVLGAVRRALGRGALTEDAKRELDQRLAAHPRNLQPAVARESDAARILERFVQAAEAADVTVERLSSAETVPEAVAGYLQSHNLPPRLRLSPGADSYPWERAPLVEVSSGVARGEDRVALTPALAGVAETGTLVLESGADKPTALNFLPEHHVVALRASELVASPEDVWDRLREAASGGPLPRTVNLITGPSRTGDIELTIHLGAHGPRALHVLLIEDEG